VEEQVVVIFAGTRGFLDKVDVNRVGAFEKQLLNELRGSEIMTSIRDNREIKKDVDGQLEKFLGAFVGRFNQGAEKK
jgi:F-type H+-transporting ATPase subunit alpha